MPPRRNAEPPDPFLLWLKAHGLPLPIKEFRFAPGRKFRADYCWRNVLVIHTFHSHMRNVILEVNGSVWGRREAGVWKPGARSGHSSGSGLIRDYAKANLAQRLGFIYLQYTPQQLMTPQTLADLRSVLL